MRHIDEVARLLENAGMSIKLNMCFFVKETIDDAGYVIAPGKQKVATKTTEAIEALQYQKMVSEL